MSQYEHKLPIRLTQAIIGGATVQAADARDLHAYLEVGRDFTNWIKARIKQYGFEEGRDFVTDARSPILASGNRGAATDYLVILDMAKELAMVERNDRGKEARRYFIECERHVTAQAPTSVRDPHELQWVAWHSLSTDERRTRQRDVILYGRAYGTLGLRHAMLQSGMPLLPGYLIGARAQYELGLGRQQQSSSVRVSGGG